MKGKRVYKDRDGNLILNRGDYGQDADGRWLACLPNGLLGNLGGHDVIEHEDGTISVSPSILTSDGQDRQWHGFLECGVWREV